MKLSRKESGKEGSSELWVLKLWLGKDRSDGAGRPASSPSGAGGTSPTTGNSRGTPPTRLSCHEDAHPARGSLRVGAGSH